MRIPFVLVGVLVGCTKAPEIVCSEEIACGGIGEVCVEGQCVEARCANSTQCPMESYCSAGECLPGCTDESDCYPGSYCNVELQTCEADSCTDSNVDCGFREFCNTATGDCYDAGDQYCKFCDEDYECGEGNYCINHYCGVSCDDGQECPAGFECYTFTDNVGNPITQQCFTYCWLYEDYQGGEFVVGPPAPTLPIPMPPKGQPPRLGASVPE